MKLLLHKNTFKNSSHTHLRMVRSLHFEAQQMIHTPIHQNRTAYGVCLRRAMICIDQDFKNLFICGTEIFIKL